MPRIRDTVIFSNYYSRVLNVQVSGLGYGARSMGIIFYWEYFSDCEFTDTLVFSEWWILSLNLISVTFDGTKKRVGVELFREEKILRFTTSSRRVIFFPLADENTISRVLDTPLNNLERRIATETKINLENFCTPVQNVPFKINFKVRTKPGSAKKIILPACFRIIDQYRRCIDMQH